MLKSATPKLPRWQRTRQSLLARQIDISLSAIKLMGYLWWDSTIARRFPHHRNRRAQWLVGTLLDLGPTFIKIGQALSTRGDLLPAEYIQALGQLQDRVPAFSADEAIATIEAELGSPLYTLYRDFDRVPIAAASLGQVHKARLHTGEDVIIKVQRPGLDTLFDLDFKVLRRLLWFAQRYLPWTQEHDLEAIYQEFADVLYQEIDYVQEAINADRFRHNFRDHPRILAPKVYPKYTTKKVLTMDYVPGIKINDRQSLEAIGVNAKEVNQLGICAYLKQLLQDGFFQADPHPGNMAVSLDGSLIFYDFGMMAEVKAIDKDQMIRTFFAVLRKDTDQVISTLTAMGLIETVSDMTPIRRVMGFVLERFTEKPVALQEFSQVRQEVSALFAQQPFRLPPKMTFILKALTTLDGVARDLDPQYSLMESAKPFVKSMTLAKGQPGGFGELTRQARDYITYKLRQPSATERLIQQLEARLEQGEQELRARSLDTDRALKTIHLAIRTLTYACLTGFTLLSAAVLLVGGYKIWAFVAFGLTGLGALASVRALIRLSIRERIDRLVK